MRVTFPIDVPPDAWARLADPAVLAAALPGCRSVTLVAGPAGPARGVATDGARGEDGGRGAGVGEGAGFGALRLVVDLSVASVRGLWAGTVERVDDDAVRVAGSGEPGVVDLVVRADASRSRLTVEGTVDGPLATVGSAVLAAAVHRMAKELLGAAGAPALRTRGDGSRSGEDEAMDSGSETHCLDPVSAEPVTSGTSLSGASRSRVAAGVSAAIGLVVTAVVVLGRRRRSRRRSG
jgi:carbon monoxide dehydrogenase subunit G